MFWIRCLSLLLMMLLAGCAATPKQPEVVVTVCSRLTPPAKPRPLRCVILPGSPALDPSDIIYGEFEQALEKWLREEGHTVVASPEKADTAVFLFYDHRPVGADERPKASGSSAQLPLAPVKKQARSLKYWKPLRGTPGYVSNKQWSSHLLVQAAPLIKGKRGLMVGEPLWTIRASDGTLNLSELRPAIPYFFESLRNLPGRNAPFPFPAGQIPPRKETGGQI